MSYTERFTEKWALLGKINPASYNSEQNTGYVSCANYDRVVVIVHAGVLGQNVTVHHEQGTDTSGSGAKSLDSGNKDVTMTATVDNNQIDVQEIKGADFDVAGGFDCLNVELTPAGSSSIIGCQIWGYGKYLPVSTSGLDSIAD